MGITALQAILSRYLCVGNGVGTDGVTKWLAGVAKEVDLRSPQYTKHIWDEIYTGLKNKFVKDNSLLNFVFAFCLCSV